MPEIGPTLREARMRARIDISEVEAETKIRAKYLRALENEEWDLLPGPTFVKSFLRTYADALGLDSRALVEEYKLRHERLSEVDLQPITPRGTADQRRRGGRGGRGGGIPRVYLIWGAILLVLGGVYAITALGGGGSSKHTSSTQTTPASHATAPATTPSTTSSSHTKHGATKGSAKIVRLQLIPSAPVNVCLVAAGGRTLLRDVTVSSRTRTFRSSEFRMTLGNGNVTMRIDGAVKPVPDVSNGIGYAVTHAGRRTLGAGQRPTCT
jgi:cytoskeleton protein RodZ